MSETGEIGARVQTMVIWELDGGNVRFKWGFLIQKSRVEMGGYPC
jgi:hypothetical protein